MSSRKNINNKSYSQGFKQVNSMKLLNEKENSKKVNVWKWKKDFSEKNESIFIKQNENFSKSHLQRVMGVT